MLYPIDQKIVYDTLLIVALGTLQTSDVFNFHGLVIVQFQQIIIVGVALGIHVCFAMAIYAPAHGEQRILFYYIHLLYGAMTSLAFYARYIHVLRVIEVGQVGQVMYAHPLYGRIGFYGSQNFGYFRLPGYCALSDLGMTIHTNIRRRDIGAAALHGASMAIFTLYFILSGMHLVRKCNRLAGLVTLLHTYGKQSVNDGLEGYPRHQKDDQKNEARALNYTVEGNR